MTEDAVRLATEMWSTAVSQQQCVRQLADDGVAEEVRRRVRRLARADGIEVRTARLGDTVVVVRLDAQVWHEDAATMRQKLAPDPQRTTGAGPSASGGIDEPRHAQPQTADLPENGRSH